MNTTTTEDTIMSIIAFNFMRGDIIVPAGFTYPERALRVDSFDGDTLKAHPENGGFGYEIPFAALRGYDFKVVDVEKFQPTWRKAKFSIGGDREFEGYHWGNNWNGWACPMFTLEVAREIAADFQCPEMRIEVDGQDRVVITHEEFPEETDVDEGDTRVRHGIPTMKLYGIGSHSWCWDVAE
tara:strand:+ start:128 stop:673 length:546 start_codon:yes stop_codon:yes gene_type:complete